MLRVLSSLAFSLSLLAASSTAAHAGVSIDNAAVVSVGSSGTPFDVDVRAFAVSKSGRWQVFASPAKNVVANVDPFGEHQIYLRDVKTGATELVSHPVGGGVANGTCDWPAVSDDGTRIAFTSTATNLGFASGGKQQVVLVDRKQQFIRLCSKTPIGFSADNDCYQVTISGDGTTVGFASGAPNLKPFIPAGPQIYVHDVAADSTSLVSVNDDGIAANEFCSAPVLSRTGRYVLFVTGASNIPEDGTGILGQKAILRDLKHGTSTLISKSLDGTKMADATCATMSPNARYIAFFSATPDLVPGNFPSGPAGYVVDRTKHTMQRFAAHLAMEDEETPTEVSISKNGGRVAMTSFFLIGGDVNPQYHGYVYDRVHHTHALLAMQPEPSSGAGEDVQHLVMRSNGKRVYLESRKLADSLLGIDRYQVFGLGLGGL